MEQSQKTIEFFLHPNQIKVFNDPSRFRVVCAGRRYGKTILAVTELILSAIAKPKRLLWYVSPTYRQSKMISWKMLKDLMPKEFNCKWNEAELSCELPNESRIELKGCDTPDGLKGVGLDGLVIDEIAAIRESRMVWQEVLRPMLADKKGWALFISTPKGKDYFWEIFQKGERKDDGYSSWHFTSYDNPFIDRAEIDSARIELSDRFFAQEFLASFEEYTGLIYPEFDEKLHVVDGIELNEEMEYIGGIDPAITGTTGALKACVVGDTIYVYSEYYERDKRISEICGTIKDDKTRWYADPAIKKFHIQKEGKLFTLYNEFCDQGISPILADNDVNAGINRVAEMFKSGKIKIHRSCTNLVNELLKYHWCDKKENSGGDMKPKPYKSEDHLCFVSGTKIKMHDLTQKNIQDIKIGDYVMTSLGKQKVIDCGVTGETEVITVKFSNGARLKGTRNHPVYTTRGKITLDSLRYDDIICTWEKSYSRIENIFGTENILFHILERLRVAKDFMLRFGKMLTDEFLEVCAFITSTITDATTTFPILPLYQEANIAPSTQKKDFKIRYSENRMKSIWKGYVLSLQCGMGQQKDLFGTAKTAKKCGRTENLSKENANFVRKNFKPSIISQDSVPTIVSQANEEKRGKTTKQRLALFVLNLFNPINTRLQKPVRVLAQVSHNQLQKVYNLTVENAHNYFANGILVSNCDVLRYLAMSRTSHYVTESPTYGEHSLRRYELQDATKEKVFR